jgi:guanine nucleotide-binding protein alpha-1 subunit
MDSVPQVKPSTPSISVSRSSSSVRLPGTNLTDNHRRIRMRLSPLISMEAALARKLLPENFDPERSSRDICVRANSGWKTTLERATSPDARPGSSTKSGARRVSSRPGTSDTRSRDDPTAVLAACKDDILLLWEDPIVKDVLKKHNVRLEDSPGL